jgi:pimeloyl-ACP methyl ester carboxylesterase
MRFLFFLLFFGIQGSLFCQEVTYPYELKYLALQPEGKPTRMAYMDVQPEKANGSAVLLLHGKNFNGYYWKDVIPVLAASGYRVVVPDQVGWGRSGKPDLHYSFHLLALHTKMLLDTLGISKIHVVGHSMGGMLATRFTLMYPKTVDKLVLENPIGLEDYKTFLPYQTVTNLAEKESKATYETYKKYQQTYYPVWKGEYEQYVQAQAESLTQPNFQNTAWVNALTYQMIYEQPVFYEFHRVKKPTLIIIGQEDRTVVGKDQLPKDSATRYGHYPTLGRWLQKQIKGSKLVALSGVGHIPHIQVPDMFRLHLLQFLDK